MDRNCLTEKVTSEPRPDLGEEARVMTFWAKFIPGGRKSKQKGRERGKQRGTQETLKV